MGFDVALSPQSLVVELTRWDSAANLRRRLDIDLGTIEDVGVEPRAGLERLIDHRVLGIGAHVGERRPNRRRVGTMLGRGVSGKQFWAVPASEGSRRLVVVDLSPESEIRRLVLAVDDPDGLVTAIEGARRA